MDYDLNFASETPSDDDPKLPPRSRLYSLQPIGSGTPEVESATSYLARLAIAHCVSTWTLLRTEIAPKLFGPEANLRNRLSELVAAMGSAFNGENDTSRKVIQILSLLTGREDLGRMTMAFCHGFVGPRFLVRVKQAWCSSCLAEEKASGGEIYYRLLWHLHGVKACPVHAVPLHDHCPACHRSFHALSARVRPGYCPRCGSCLTPTASQKGVGGLAIDLATEVATAQRVADFLLAGQQKLSSDSVSTFAGNMERLVNGCFAGNVAAVARFLAISRYSVLAWKGGAHRPTLLSLVDLSHRVNVPMTDLLGTKLGGAEFSIQMDCNRQPGKRLFTSPPKTDLEKMQRSLESAAKGDVFPPQSLSKLAKELACNQTTLQRRFPKLTAEIKKRYQNYHSIRIEVRTKLFRAIVKAAVMDLHKAGIYPSQCRVREAVPRFVDMREPSAYDEWKRTLAQLNDRVEAESTATIKWPPHFGYDKMAKAAIIS